MNNIETTNCPNCRKLLSEEEKNNNECMICHHKIIKEIKYCPHCKTGLSDTEISSLSCWTCGKSFENPLDNSHIIKTNLSQKDILLTTAPHIEGYRILETIDIISAETVIGMNIFKDIATKITDVFGGRSKITQKALKEAKNNCLSELRGEAELIGANAVIGVDLDYSEISAQGKSMLFLVASGTAVKAEKII